MLYFGTHNSGTGGSLVWWQWLLTPIFQLVSQCQEKSIEEQLEMGVKVFNLQITWYKGDWHFSHGLCVYKEKFSDALNLMESYARVNSPIYYQLYLDKNFFLGQDKDKFLDLVKKLSFRHSPEDNVKLLYAWIEGTDNYPYSSGIKLNLQEHYWTTDWANLYGESWVDKLPLPKRHAKKYNKDYKEKCKNSNVYLMLDFFEI